MIFNFDKTSWTTIAEGEKNCYLMANGLGGYNSMNLVGGLTRGDQAFFMAAKKAPNVRWNMVTGLLEKLTVDGKEYVLTSQRMQDKEDLEGFRYLESFTFDNYPVWVYKVAGVAVTKTIVMVQGENTVAVNYEIEKGGAKNVFLSVKPMLRVTAKNTAFEKEDAKKKHKEYMETNAKNDIHQAAGIFYDMTELFSPFATQAQEYIQNL